MDLGRHKSLGILSVHFLTRLLFPPFCLHCDKKTDNHRPVCTFCLELLSITPLNGIKGGKPITTFEGIGPAVSLVHALKSGKFPSLSKGLAGFMGFQYLTYNLPKPDLIVPVPQSFYRAIQVGYNPSFLLAYHLGELLSSPVVSLLKRKDQLVRQMRIEKDRRYELSIENFQWAKRFLSSVSFIKPPPSISGKTLLLVDDLIGTGTTLKCCERRLYEGFPRRIIKMAFLQEII